MAIKLMPPRARNGKNRYFVAYGWWRGIFERSLHTTDPGEAQTRFADLQREFERQKSLGVVSRAQAFAAYDALLIRWRERATARLGYATIRPFTFSDAVALYLTYRRPEKQWLKAVRALKRQLGDRAAASLTTDDLIKAAVSLYPRARNETRNRMVLSPAAAILHHAADCGRIPWIRVKKFKERASPPRAVSRDVANILIAATSGMRRVFLLFLFKHGWRIGETLRLQWGDIDMKEGVVRRYLRKTNEWQTIPLQHEVQAAIEGEVPPERRTGRVFSWGDRQNVYRWLKPLCQSLGVRFTPHMARHSFATWLVNDGATPMDVMEAGGWRDMKSVTRYGRVSRARLRSLLDRGSSEPPKLEIIRHSAKGTDDPAERR